MTASRRPTDRAQAVLAAQGRLNQLLAANAAVVSELSVPVVLRQVVTAARDLVGAGYAALTVVAPDGSLEHFEHVGRQAHAAQGPDGPPRGEGVLGPTAQRPRPVRLGDPRHHTSVARTVPGARATRPVLGVPIRVRGEVLGSLHLTDGDRGGFTEEDEQLVVALAATAGIAIAHARLFEEAQQQRRWLRASTELTQQLFARAVASPLTLVAQHAMDGARADLASLVTSAGGARGTVEAAVGAIDTLQGRELDLGETLVGQVLRSGEPRWTAEHPVSFAASAELAADAVAIGAVVAVPLRRADGQVMGALTVGRVAGRAQFTAADCDQLSGFALHAGVALDLDRARARDERERSWAERSAIAQALHERAIGQLFATGMGLQSLMSQLTEPAHRARVARYVDDLDASIRAIRSSVLGLPSGCDAGGST